MRSILLILAISVLPLGSAIPGAPMAVGTGPVALEGSDCDIIAIVEIEGASRAAGEWQAMGTGVVSFESPCWIWNIWPFAGGQSFEFGAGSCRVLADGTGECWYGWGWDPEAPNWDEPEGYYMRLDHDGAFVFYSPDQNLAGALARV